MKRLSTDDLLIICRAEAILEYDKWIEKIPYLKFPKSWYVKIIPPFGEKLVRFHVSRYPESEKYVSVYFDAHDLISVSQGYPYWEVYPCDGSIFRCSINDTEELIKAISRGLRSL